MILPPSQVPAATTENTIKPFFSAPFMGADRCANGALPPEILLGINLANTKGSRILRLITVNAARQTFLLAVAQSDYDESMGLMCVRHLRPNTGMLFDFHKQTSAEFWMKNTTIPLDVLWLNEAGIITRIDQNVPAQKASTKEKDITKIVSTGRFLIELAAGSVANSQVTVGMQIKVTH